ncbi:winged helix-turn-helix transcriptional regulator [Metabacillus endolithicus]|uniref:Winged helix-turn-helix transcriptional regulator n=1 Tax=Metabacillus endolithicus TaxID=1535204 RepID=A0ABW5BXQ8_9BACI|nr:helix-turn-helix domain-containing protein [Metabacillus endolithicus]UPG64179.1 helix-turn-helix transcriptional regulator [Metabacillus endolithicus]
MKINLCPKMESAFRLLGKRWIGIIIHVLLDGPKRFKDLTDIIPSISQKMLSERLKELENEGLLKRIVIDDTPVKVIYELTEKGKDLTGVINEIGIWANKHCFEQKEDN